MAAPSHQQQQDWNPHAHNPTISGTANLGHPLPSSPSPTRLHSTSSPYGSPGLGMDGGKPLSACSMSPKDLPQDDNQGSGRGSPEPGQGQGGKSAPFYPRMSIVGKSETFYLSFFYCF